MTHTVIPTAKGQIIIPIEIRKKYNIGKKTPILVDEKNGIITLRITRMMEQSDIELRENGITFKKGINPQELIDAIREIDG